MGSCGSTQQAAAAETLPVEPARAQPQPRQTAVSVVAGDDDNQNHHPVANDAGTAAAASDPADGGNTPPAADTSAASPSVLPLPTTEEPAQPVQPPPQLPTVPAPPATSTTTTASSSDLASPESNTAATAADADTPSPPSPVPATRTPTPPPPPPPTPPHVKAGFAGAEVYEAALLNYARQQEGGERKELDYSEAFGGGSQSMYEEEKEFENMLMGREGAESGGPFALAVPCVCGQQPGQPHAEACGGRWLRTLNKQGNCWLYVHTITHELRGSRPPDFEAPEDEGEGEGEEAAAGGSGSAATARDDAPPAICAAEARAAVEAAYANKRTALLLCSAGGRAAVLDALQPGAVLDTRPLVLPLRRTGIKFADAVETARGQLVQAMRDGCLAVLDLGDRCPDFCGKFEPGSKNAASLPLALFDAADRTVHQTVFSRAKGDGAPVLADGYRLCLLATLSAQEARRELPALIPFQHVDLIVVDS